jgi:hypothetical protein
MKKRNVLLWMTTYFRSQIGSSLSVAWTSQCRSAIGHRVNMRRLAVFRPIGCWTHHNAVSPIRYGCNCPVLAHAHGFSD